MIPVCVVGIGDTDYRQLYRPRSSQPQYDPYGLAARAFLAAVDDAGIEKREIDGLVAGVPTPYNRLAQVLGLEPQWGITADVHSGLLAAIGAINAGLASCVAMIYGQAGRSLGVSYGGISAQGADRFLAYTYYSPFGFTSQGAIYAMVAQRMLSEGILTPEQLAQVSISQRDYASRNGRAVMQEPIDLSQYMKSRYVAEPLRLLDYCLVNDGGVALILRRAEDVTDKVTIQITAAARSDATKQADTLVPRVVHRYRRQYSAVAERLFQRRPSGWAGIGALYIYDSFSIHVPMALEGLGACEHGSVGEFLENGEMARGGRLPINTHGGNLSESYMQGWNHQVEVVRQLRGEADGRQVPGIKTAMYVSGGGGEVLGLLYERIGDAREAK